jgi:hypothetical protein
MIHELFHRIQAELGLMTETGQNEHLETVDGRCLLRLEWRALAQALRNSGEQRKRAISDALAFRLARRTLFVRAAENECRDEIREGLAQYTGTVLSAASERDAASRAVEQLIDAEKQESFVQSFAYTSGTAYGVLLDSSSRGWRARVTATSDLAQMLKAALEIHSAEKTEAAAARYGGKELRAAEEQRDARRKTLVSDLRKRFIDGPVLLLPAGGGGTFDIRGATAIPGSGTVYFSNYRITGEWGSLEATTGVLLSNDGTRRVPGPVRLDGANLTGDGWRVTVAPPWVVRTGPRSGDYELIRGNQ